MKTINHESDFKLLVGYSDGSPINEPFRFTFYTKVSRGTLIAEYDGSEYANCYPDGGMVKIPFDKPMLGMGVLSVKIELFLNDADFKDGKYDYVSVEPTGIILDKGATEPFEDMEILISKPNTRGLQMFLSKPYLGEGGGSGGTSLIEVTDNPKKAPADNTIAINTSNGKVFFGIANKGWWFVTAQMLGSAEIDGDTLKISAEYDNGTISVSGEVKDGLLIL